MPSPTFPVRLQTRSGLGIEVNANGSLRRIDHGNLMLNSFLGTEMDGGPANLYLRRREPEPRWVPLLGPHSPGRLAVGNGGTCLTGTWEDIGFTARLLLDEASPAWRWAIELTNQGTAAVEVDLVYAQDLALAHYAAVRNNEYYVSQYVDFTPLAHSRCGTVLAVRQNLPMDGRHPWALLGSTRRAVGFATDALQLHGLAARAGDPAAVLGAAQLPSTRLQHEHGMAVLQGEALRLEPGQSAAHGFFGWFEADHPGVSSDTDLAFADRALALPAPGPAPTLAGKSIAATLFSQRAPLPAQDADEDLLRRRCGAEWRHVERDCGTLLSFFADDRRHVVLRAKEMRVLRPHGHLLRSGDHLVPDESSLTSTVWMNGVFHSQVTQGHVNINRLLSTVRGYLGLHRAAGQRVFVDRGDGFELLDMPSAFEMAPNGCRWIYRHAGGLIEVRAWAPIDRHELCLSIEVVEGGPCRFLVTHLVALNGDDGAEPGPVRRERDDRGVKVRPGANGEIAARFPQGYFRIDPAPGTDLVDVGGDEMLFVDGASRGLPFVTLLLGPTRRAGLRLTGHLLPATATDLVAPLDAESDLARSSSFWDRVTGALTVRAAAGTDDRECAQLQEILPWLAHNALVHYLAPRGLEQFSGGGWGTRDVCQGPVEMLLALGEHAPLRDLLLRVFRAQNAAGDWPQWFMFFDRERNIRPDDSHGDVIFWPLLALGQYVDATHDASILEVELPYFHPDGDARAERETIKGHVVRALDHIARSLIPGTSLAAYGHGDWNDSLQPADPAMSQRLCSSWTVTLHHQMLVTLARALRGVGHDGDARDLEDEAARVKDDFQRWLVIDGTIPGYIFFTEDGRAEPWLHPRDSERGVSYSLLPMIHAVINDLLTPEQAAAHAAQIRAHLLGADGARLFDRPFPYQGGVQRYFQRAETSTYFGREIGIMYTHAHLRYAESLARLGEAESLFLALRQANPLSVRDVVPSARRRQSNCYYSSSDAVFADRYEALAGYDRVRTGEVDFEGGWRVYSSGAGIATRLVRECFLGLRERGGVLAIDPVLPSSLDGLRVGLRLRGRALTVHYRVGARGHGPTAVRLNGAEVPVERETNPYRRAGVRVDIGELLERLVPGENLLEVEVG